MPTLPPPPPAHVQPAPAPDREVAFAGFNGVALKGALRPGGAHPWFVVMVADSGPTDRNGSTKLVPKATHALRDWAAWLQQRGLGSLRFDKRYVGVWDPKMDISLAAQAGDVRAAVTFARRQPEARGKRILVLGHGEGALLALVAATDAEGLLLVAPPAASMGRMVRDQVGRQLAASGADEATTAANLGHLDQVFEAIRRGEEAPVAAPAVAPGVVRLGQGLLAGAQRPFVRDTLDLDPWLMAARFPGPLAALWGAQDALCPKPSPLPAFRGAVLEIPDANHLLKRETRDSRGLSGFAVLDTFGDDTPLADLTPLEAWLKDLR